MQHYYGLDIGIGSVGWSVLEVGDDDARILDFGVRLFSSGEDTKTSETKNQKRRAFRSKRRVLRRKKHRRDRLKKYFVNLGIVTEESIAKWYVNHAPNIYKLRARGLDEMITPEELVVSLIHISNHRGYKEFYDDNTQDAKETERIKGAVQKTRSLLENSAYRTVGEMIARDKTFINEEAQALPRCRNHQGDYNYMFLRKDIEKEAKLLLNKQQEFHDSLTDKAIKEILEIIFYQRYFEYGPGNYDDAKRRYRGFLHSEVNGSCAVYKDEIRGPRHTVIGDLFALINALSQYSYFAAETGEEADFGQVVRLVKDYVLQNCRINKTELKKLLKENGIEALIPETAGMQDIGKCVKYLPPIRHAIQQAGLDWAAFISEEQFDLSHPSQLHRLGKCLSSYITPSLRREKLSELGYLNAAFIENSLQEKYSGTANVSDKYMLEVILEAIKGSKAGDYQARTSAGLTTQGKKGKHLPNISDREITSNPVVFRAVNETRKVINALISKYGQQPAVINVEVANELGRGEEARKKISKAQTENEKQRAAAKEKIKELFKIEKPNAQQIERYLLYQSQNCKSLYSDTPIDLDKLLTDDYEVDHIIPYSLILDDSRNNKALVTTKENRDKGRRPPLEYLKGEQRTEFKKRVIYARRKGLIGKKKYNYLMLNSLANQTLLDEWKTRNINDTRYITRFIVGFLQQNLFFDSPKAKNVHGINGAVTSRFRHIWLKNTEWGKKEKDRSKSQLHHAIDAIVVANLTPANIELASDYLKLQRMRKDYKMRELPAEYYGYLSKCCEKMNHYYGYNRDYTQHLLEGGRVPSVIQDLSREIAIRFDSATPQELIERAEEYYKDKEFAARLHLPLVSRKMERKFRGRVVSSDNPVSNRRINGQTYKFTSKPLEKINLKDIAHIVGVSEKVKQALHQILDGQEGNVTLGDYLKEHSIPELIRRNGRTARKLTIAEKEENEVYIKTLPAPDGSQSTQLWENRQYYCLEVYRDTENKTRVRGLKYTDFKKANGRLFLAITQPEGYGTHIMYLFKNDYIEVQGKGGNITKKGFYQAIKAANKGVIYIFSDNSVENQAISLAQSCTVKRYAVSILGEKGGEIVCGAPYLSLPEKK